MSIRILGLSGSLRAGSFNTKLLNAAVGLMPEGAELVVGSIRDVPLYDGDLEARAFPPAVTALKDQIAAADAVLLVTPEYNGSLPGVFKNAIDWTTRPGSDIGRVWGGRPVALTGATPGRVGTALSQRTWLGVLKQLRVVPWFGPPLYVSDAGSIFDSTGALTDDGTRERLAAFLKGFAEFAGKHRKS